MRQLSGIFDYDEDSFLSFYRSIRRQMKPQEAEQGLVDGMLTPVKKVLFEWVATQEQRVKRPLFDPMNRFEVPMLTRWLVKATVVVNTWLYCWLHGETEMVDWDVFFDDPDHLYVSFRWLGDFPKLDMAGCVLGNVSIVLWVRKVDFVLERVCFKGDCFWIDMGR